MIEKLNEDQKFEDAVKQGATFVKFGAEWCGPCKAMEPVLEELAKKYEGRVRFISIDIDQHMETAAKYKIRSVPTSMMFINGEPKQISVGSHGLEYYRKQLEETLPQ